MKHCQEDVSISRPTENQIDLSLPHAINLCKYVLMTTLLVISFICSSSHMKTQASTVQKSTSLVTRPLQPGRKMQEAGGRVTPLIGQPSYASLCERFLKGKLSNLLMLQH